MVISHRYTGNSSYIPIAGNLPFLNSFVTILVANFTTYGYETGGHWVPGSESCRTASGPEGSSAKASLSGAQDYLVAIGSMPVSNGVKDSGDWRLQ